MTLNAFLCFVLTSRAVIWLMLMHEILARQWVGVCAGTHCFKFAYRLSASFSLHTQYICMILYGLNIQTNNGKKIPKSCVVLSKVSKEKFK